MGNDNFDQITFDLTDYELINSNIEDCHTYDMHGYPLFDAVQSVQNELQEEHLRSQHADLQAAYEEYQTLLKKYKFWDTVTK